MTQARRKKSKKLSKRARARLRRALREVVFAALFGLSLLLLLALISFSRYDPGWTHTGSGNAVRNLLGVPGAWVADLLLHLAGYIAYLLPPGLMLLSWRLFRRSRPLDPEFVFYRLLGGAVVVLAGCGFAHLALAPLTPLLPAGGLFGSVIGGDLLLSSFGLSPQPAGLLLLLLLLAGVSLLTDWSWLQMIDFVGSSAWLLMRALIAPFVPLRQSPATAAADDGRDDAPAAGEVSFHWRQLTTRLGRFKNRLVDLWPEYIGGDDERDDDAPRAQPKRAAARREPVIGDAQTALPLTPPEQTWIDDDGPRDAAETFSAPPPAKRAAKKSRAKPDPAPAADDADDWQHVAASSGESGPLPPLTLLEMAPQEDLGFSQQTLDQMSTRLTALLRDFGVEVEVVNAIPGPVITRFELSLAPGVKGTQISNLAKDLARGLSVVSVRIEEIIPGKPYVGLEIPNQQRAVVFLSEILGSAVYRRSPSPLTLALGKDIAGRSMITDLGSMPHLLVAGTTGSGKSVALNVMLLSILYKAPPSDVRLIMIDPKMLELSIYEGIPHLLAPVVTDMKEAANALRWCTIEMERRYRLMSTLKVRHIRGYNQKVSEAIKRGQPLRDPTYTAPNSLEEVPTLEPLPYVVVVIDELADMMMTVGKKVEELIVRLAQKARAAGIHLILATQRPSVDVITGLIKSNIPARIAFQVASKIDSRTILDQMGAEALLGHGDMLMLGPNSSGGIPQRIHGAFVNDHEVQHIVEFLKSSGSPDYSDDILSEPEAEAAAGDGLSMVDGETDALYDQAVRIVLETRRATISSLQRRLGIGYNRSARIIEAMEQAGLISPQQSNGMREILVAAPGEQEG